MKPYSLTRRLVIIMLSVELLLTAGATGLALFYEREENLRTFDVMLRGRADSLLGAVQDTENAADDMMLEPEALDLHHGDFYEVREVTGKTVGQSSPWNAEVEKAIGDSGSARSFRLNHKWYRGFALHGVRRIDPDDSKGGTPRPVIVYYAASLRPFREAMNRASKFLIISNGLILFFTGGTLLLLLRRGMAPLKGLAAAAAGVSSNSLEFQPSAEALAIEELAVLARALESAMNRLKLAFAQQQSFVNDAAHELKTAVTIVKSSMQLLISQKRTAEQYDRGLEVCLVDCGRLEELVQKLLLLARLEQGRESSSAPSATDVSECLSEIEAQMRPLALLEGVEVHLERNGAAMASIAYDDCAILSTNLVLNALQHTPAGGRVTLRVQSMEKSVRIDVEDTGTGILPQDLPSVFERFYRGDPSRSRRTGGTGLGLAICKAIVDASGGRIDITSEIGRGTRAVVILPSVAKAGDSQIRP
jgi:signal transduction histidine kinase